MNDWYERLIEVIPAPGQIVETAQALLALADDPAHVLTQGNGDWFLVPPYIADAYNKPLLRKSAPRKSKAGDQ
jgi:hypothetical protein